MTFFEYKNKNIINNTYIFKLPNKNIINNTYIFKLPNKKLLHNHQLRTKYSPSKFSNFTFRYFESFIFIRLKIS